MIFKNIHFDNPDQRILPMLKDLTLSEYIHQHCNESMERALLAERHPVCANSCPELKDIGFIRLGLLRCISTVDSGRHYSPNQ